MDPLSLIASFAISYLANNIPAIADLVQRNKSLDDRMKECYDRARKQWKCQAVRDRYEGKEMEYLQELHAFVIGHKDHIDNELKELIGRWVLEMQKDTLCSAFINEMKLEDLKGETNANLVEAVKKVSETLEDKLDFISAKVHDTHQATIDLGKQLNEKYETIVKKIDILSKVESPNEVVLRQLNELLQDENQAVVYCTSILLCRGGTGWYGDIENKRFLRGHIELLNVFMQKYHIYFSDAFYGDVMQHYRLAINLQNELDFLCIAISTADDQDGITDVYDLTYEQEITWTPEFVTYMLMEFNKVDVNHPSYMHYSELYIEHDNSIKRLLSQIDSKTKKAI